MGQRLHHLTHARVRGLDGFDVIGHRRPPPVTVPGRINIQENGEKNVRVGVGQLLTRSRGDAVIRAEGLHHIRAGEGGGQRRPAQEGDRIETGAARFQSLEEIRIPIEPVAGKAIIGIIDAVLVAPDAGEHAGPTGGAVGDRMSDGPIGETTIRLELIQMRRFRHRQRFHHRSVDPNDQDFLRRLAGASRRGLEKKHGQQEQSMYRNRHEEKRRRSLPIGHSNLTLTQIEK
jgi:hypothetical protein